MQIQGVAHYLRSDGSQEYHIRIDDYDDRIARHTRIGIGQPVLDAIRFVVVHVAPLGLDIRSAVRRKVNSILRKESLHIIAIS